MGDLGVIGSGEGLGGFHAGDVDGLWEWMCGRKCKCKVRFREGGGRTSVGGLWSEMKEPHLLIGGRRGRRVELADRT